MLPPCKNEPVKHSREAQDLPHLVLVDLARRDEPLLEHGLHICELLCHRAWWRGSGRRGRRRRGGRPRGAAVVVVVSDVADAVGLGTTPTIVVVACMPVGDAISEL